MTDVLQTLITYIPEAFRRAVYPGDDALTQHGDDDSIAGTLRGKHWSAVTLEQLYWHRWEMFALTPDAFRYYLPAYMLAGLQQGDQLGVVVDNLVFCLTPQNEEQIYRFMNGDDGDYFSARVRVLTVQERSAVRATLEALTELYPTVGRIYEIDIYRQTLPFWQAIG